MEYMSAAAVHSAPAKEPKNGSPLAHQTAHIAHLTATCPHTQNLLMQALIVDGPAPVHDGNMERALSHEQIFGSHNDQAMHKLHCRG